MSKLNQIICEATREKPNQWKRWKKRQTVPQSVLMQFYQKGIVKFEKPPEEGMHLYRLREFLREFIHSRCPDNDRRNEALELYYDGYSFQAIKRNCQREIQEKKDRCKRLAKQRDLRFKLEADAAGARRNQNDSLV